ncbi:hypothetical protein [Geobacillus sp. Y412MC52]|uniref:hypothetical protein n=1 Tax=Geobacillus sp. (strain Y412MC52) TaxID=550542 RepID=UPI0002F5C514|nr:hypothetical protein [Geobacillus sp. Y412MC52]
MERLLRCFPFHHQKAFAWFWRQWMQQWAKGSADALPFAVEEQVDQCQNKPSFFGE